MKYYIYKLTNTADNGKSYIGQTTNPQTRFHRCMYRAKLIKAAIDKFGWQNFSHEILADASTIAEANALERSFIEAYKTRDPNFGYNAQRGGSYSRRGYKRSPGALKKQSTTMRMKRWYYNPDTCETIRLLPEETIPEGFISGRSFDFKGIIRSEETKARMRAAQQRRRAREKRAAKMGGRGRGSFKPTNPFGHNG